MHLLIVFDVVSRGITTRTRYAHTNFRLNLRKYSVLIVPRAGENGRTPNGTLLTTYSPFAILAKVIVRYDSYHVILVFSTIEHPNFILLNRCSKYKNIPQSKSMTSN